MVFKWDVRDMEHTQKFYQIYKHLLILYKDLDIRPGVVMADVRCGSGRFALDVAEGLQGRCKIIAMYNPDEYTNPEQSIKWVQERARKYFPSEVIEFRRGHPFKLVDVLGDHQYHITYSFCLMTNLPDKRIIEQMVRITQPEGSVVCVETGPLKYHEFLCPLNEKLAKLDKELSSVETDEAFAEKFGGDMHIYEKVPKWLDDLGLRNIKSKPCILVEPFSDPEVVKHKFKDWAVPYSPPTYNPEEIVSYIRGKLDMMERQFEQDREMFKGKTFDWYSMRKEFLENLVRNPSMIKGSGIFSSDSLMIITGKK
jgi:SAM-dependent methyltransferase